MTLSLNIVKWLAATSAVIDPRHRVLVGRPMQATIIGLVLSGSATTLAQIVEWTTPAIQHGAYDVSADGLGNVYFASGGGAFVSKYDMARNLIWVRELDSVHQDEAQSVSADRLGNVFIAGETGGRGGQPGVGGDIVKGGFDAYIAKYDASGNLDWARQVPETHWTNSVSADGLGNAYVAGWTDTFNAFLAKYDIAGNLSWIRQYEAEGLISDFHGVSSDAFGNAYVTGITAGRLDGMPDYDAIVAKYDPTGNQLWLRQFGTTGTNDFGYQVSADGLGSVYVAGATNGSLDGPNAGDYDVFLRKYDESGNLLWARQLGSPAADGYIERIDVSADG
jgi:hypothetical protein